MLNFAINRKESKRFIRYYKENEGLIIVKYGNHFSDTLKSSDETKRILDEIMEEQVRNGDKYFFDESSKLRIDSRKQLGRCFFVYSIFTAAFGMLTIPVANFLDLNNVVGNYSFALSGGLLVLPVKNIVKALDLVKHKIFLVIKDNINNYLRETENRTLGINDIHNLNIFKVAATNIKANRYSNKMVLNRYGIDEKVKTSKPKQKKLSLPKAS